MLIVFKRLLVLGVLKYNSVVILLLGVCLRILIVFIVLLVTCIVVLRCLVGLF